MLSDLNVKEIIEHCSNLNRADLKTLLDSNGYNYMISLSRNTNVEIFANKFYNTKNKRITYDELTKQIDDLKLKVSNCTDPDEKKDLQQYLEFTEEYLQNKIDMGRGR